MDHLRRTSRLAHLHADGGRRQLPNAMGFALTVGLGIPVGILMGRVRLALEPFMMALYSTPVVALLPVLILWFGVSLWSKVVLGAAIALTRALAREVGDDRITVNAIAPGLTIVETTKSVAPARHRLYVEGRAIKREQFPEDITGTVVFLLSAAAFISGELLAVNGGFLLH